MIILGVDGADYHIAKNYMNVNHLEVDLEPKHTATIWTSYFSGLMPSEHKILNWKPVIGSPADVDFIWKHGEWTVFAAPVCMPPYCLRCTASDYHLKDQEEAWNTELEEFISCYDNHNTDHFAGVIRCIDVASHSRTREEALKWYERVFDLVKQIKWDLLVSDHGFVSFNRRMGEKDHSKDGIIKGLQLKRATELVEKMKRIKKTIH